MTRVRSMMCRWMLGEMTVNGTVFNLALLREHLAQ